jgi:hypothetical protein
MSDVSQGPGGGLASDGKWYPPETAPAPPSPPPPASESAAPSQQPLQTRCQPFSAREPNLRLRQRARA